MGGERYIVRLGKGCNLFHLGDSAGIAAVGLNNVDAVFREVRKNPPDGAIAFAAGQWNFHLLLDAFERLDVSRDRWFFKKEEVVRLNGGSELNHGGRGHGAMGVEHDGTVTPDALRGMQRGFDVYLFLTGMMLLAELARTEGLFDWVAAVAVALARGSPQRLFALVYAVGIVVTVLLSNDATAVVLTPAVYAATRAAGAPPLPYLFICAFIANAASFMLPISNPANLVVFGGHMPPLLAWLSRFGLASLVSIGVTYLVLRLTQHRALPAAQIVRDIARPQTRVADFHLRQCDRGRDHRAQLAMAMADPAQYVMGGVAARGRALRASRRPRSHRRHSNIERSAA